MVPCVVLCCVAATKVWTNVIGAAQEKPGVRASGSACVIPGNRMLVFGGYDGAEFLQDLWVLHTGAYGGALCCRAAVNAVCGRQLWCAENGACLCLLLVAVGGWVGGAPQLACLCFVTRLCAPRTFIGHTQRMLWCGQSGFVLSQL